MGEGRGNGGVRLSYKHGDPCVRRWDCTRVWNSNSKYFMKVSSQFDSSL